MGDRVQPLLETGDLDSVFHTSSQIRSRVLGEQFQVRDSVALGEKVVIFTKIVAISIDQNVVHFEAGHVVEAQSVRKFFRDFLDSSLVVAFNNDNLRVVVKSRLGSIGKCMDPIETEISYIENASR